MLLLAFRNLFQSRTRLLISTGGLALALLLILALDAILTGSETQLTNYINHSGADVWVSQSGVRNMHMATSTLPAPVVDRVRAVPGVADAAPILYTTSFVRAGTDRYIVYVIGLPEGARMGAPWKIREGSALPRTGEVVIDSSVARASGTRVGDTVRILNVPLRVAGLADGTANIVNSIAFVTSSDFDRLRGGTGVVSYVLVKAAPGSNPDGVARAIAGAVPSVTVQTSTQFAASEKKVVSDMVVDIAAIMNLTGLMIGLAVMALTIYIATLSRRAEFGLLKAVGARNRDLYTAVLAQTGISLVLGLATSIALVLLLSIVVPAVRPQMALELTLGSVLKVTLMAVGISAVASVLPVRQVARLEPADVFRRKL